MKKPVLGIIYNVVSIAAPFVILGAAWADSNIGFFIGIIMLIPTTVLPGTKIYSDYWRRFR